MGALADSSYLQCSCIVYEGACQLERGLLQLEPQLCGCFHEAPHALVDLDLVAGLADGCGGRVRTLAEQITSFGGLGVVVLEQEVAQLQLGPFTQKDDVLTVVVADVCRVSKVLGPLANRFQTAAQLLHARVPSDDGEANHLDGVLEVLDRPEKKETTLLKSKINFKYVKYTKNKKYFCGIHRSM